MVKTEVFAVGLLSLSSVGRKHQTVIDAIVNTVPSATKGSVKPPSSYRAPPTVGPAINPKPKKVSRMAKADATLSGNSWATILNAVVMNAAFPRASMILIRNENVRNIVVPFILFRKPKHMQEMDTVNKPALFRKFTPILSRYIP